MKQYYNTLDLLKMDLSKRNEDEDLIQKLFALNANNPNLYWKNRKEGEIPGLILYSTSNDSMLPHDDKNCVVLSIVFYKGDVDYTGCGYAFVITRFLDGEKPIVSYRTVLETALDVFETYVNEVSLQYKLADFIKNLAFQKSDTTPGHYTFLPKENTRMVWEYLFMFAQKEMKNYFQNHYARPNIQLHQAINSPNYPILYFNTGNDSRIDLFVELAERPARNWNEKPVRIKTSTIVKNILLAKAEELEKTKEDVSKESSSSESEIPFTEAIIKTLKELDRPEELEGKERIMRMATLLAYEEELIAVLKVLPFETPIETTYSTHFWDEYLKEFAKMREDGKSKAGAAANAFTKTLNEWFKMNTINAVFYKRIASPYKEDDTRLYLECIDIWNGIQTDYALTKADILLLMEDEYFKEKKEEDTEAFIPFTKAVLETLSQMGTYKAESVKTRILKVNAILYYENELIEGLTQLPFQAPAEIATSTKFWDALLEEYSLLRARKKDKAEAVCDAFVSTFNCHSKGINLVGYIPIQCPYKETDTRLTFNMRDPWNGIDETFNMTKDDIYYVVKNLDN